MINWDDIEKITILINTGSTENIIINTKFPCTFADKTLGDMKMKIETSPHIAVNYVNDLLKNCPENKKPEIQIIDLKINR